MSDPQFTRAWQVAQRANRLTPADMEHIRRSIVAQVIKVEKQLKMPWLVAQRGGFIKMERNDGQ